MTNINKFVGLLAILLVADLATSCDIIVHIKSKTNTVFQAQVLAPNGQKSEKWTFSKNRQRETFQQKASECGIKEWEIIVFDSKGLQKFDEKVLLNGIGRVLYEIGDDLKPKQVERQGAICNGNCAPLNTPSPPSSRSASRASSIDKEGKN